MGLPFSYLHQEYHQNKCTLCQHYPVKDPELYLLRLANTIHCKQLLVSSLYQKRLWCKLRFLCQICLALITGSCHTCTLVQIAERKKAGDDDTAMYERSAYFLSMLFNLFSDGRCIKHFHYVKILKAAFWLGGRLNPIIVNKRQMCFSAHWRFWKYSRCEYRLKADLYIYTTFNTTSFSWDYNLKHYAL